MIEQAGGTKKTSSKKRKEAQGWAMKEQQGPERAIKASKNAGGDGNIVKRS